MASTFNLTKFPVLYSETQDVHLPGEYSENLVSDEVIFTDEVVILSWASLLKAYTGEDLPVFAVDDRAVCVDPETRTIQTASVSELNQYATAIHFLSDDSHTTYNPDISGILESSMSKSSSGSTESDSLPASQSRSPFDPALILHCNLETGYCCISTTGKIPPDHLTEIWRQFNSFLHQEMDLDTPWNATEDGKVQQSIINPCPAFLKGPQLLHDLVFHNCNSNQVAIDFKNADSSRTMLTYDSLRHHSIRFAAKLRRCLSELGTRGGQPQVIPILVPQSAELYVALLSVLEIGAAFCPLNLDTPPDRIEFILKDVGARVVVVTPKDSNRLSALANVTTCVLEDIDSTHSVLPKEDARCDENDTGIEGFRPPSPRDWAYVLYTSGSTGQPKGVTLSNLAVTQSLLAHDPLIPNYSRFLQFASPTFDVSMFEIFFTLYRGSTLVGCNRRELLNDLPGAINELEIDGAELTPTVAGSLLGKRRDVPGLKVLLTIGEMLTAGVVREFGASLTQPALLYGMYGPTEAAIHCTAALEFASSAKNGIIGYPFETVSAFIAKPDHSISPPAALEVLPVGQIGELVVGGHQLADGYLNREEQTKTVFVNHESYGRLYRTGDKARMLPDGSLECLGRIQSGQVKLRGQRIELGEIEQAAMQTEGCNLAVAIVIRDNLVVFCLIEGNEIHHEHVLETCSRWLLPYMMPNDVVFRKSFPQLASGKVDKKSLEASYDAEDEHVLDDPRFPESAELVVKICDAAENVLHRPVQAASDLPKLGLDSLRAIQLASQLRSSGIETTALDVMDSGSVRNLCSRLGRTRSRLDLSVARQTFDRVKNLTIAKAGLEEQQQDIEDILPCTPLQTSMLMETLRDPQAYCNWIELEFDEDMNREAVSKALQAAIEANPMLRSGFVAVDDHSIGFAQIVWNSWEQSQICLTGSEIKKDFSMRDSEEFKRPLKVSIFIVSSKVHVLVQIHHALYDGWSIDLLSQDLAIALGGGQIAARPSFRKVTEHLIAASESSIADEARDYWERQLADCQPVPLPKLSHNEAMDQSSVQQTTTHDIQLDLKALVQHDNIHPQIYFQSALSYLLSTWVGSIEMIIGCVSSGRTLPVDGIEDIIGPCLSTLPLRVDLSRSKSLHNLLNEVHESTRQMLAHCTLPLQEVKKLANVDPGQPLFDTVFIWQESLFSSNDDSRMKLRQVDSADFLESNLLIEAEPQGGVISLRASQRERILSESQVKLLLRQIGEVVKGFVEQTPATLSSLTISDIVTFMSEDVISARSCHLAKDESKIFDVVNQSLLPTEINSCIVSEGPTSSNWAVLPLGAVGNVAIQKDLATVSKDVDMATYHYPMFGEMCLTPFVGRIQDNGRLHILGHTNNFDWQSKLKINLSLLSDCMRRLPQVDDCFSFVSQHDTPQVLVSCFVPPKEFKARIEADHSGYIAGIGLPATGDLISSVQAIFDGLRSQLPRHMIPTHVIPIDSIPWDKKEKSGIPSAYTSLPNDGYLEYFGEYQTDSFQDPGNERKGIEKQISDVLATTLKMDSDFGRSVSFFRLGLDSISAISVARDLSRRLPTAKVDVASILRYPTVGRLASYISSQMWIGSSETYDRDDSQLPEEIVKSVKTVYETRGLSVGKVRPCTPLQEGMLAAVSEAAYSNHTQFKLFKDPRKFQTAFEVIFKRHDILRTCFTSTENPKWPFLQVVLEDYQMPWTIERSNETMPDEIVKHIMSRNMAALDTMRPPLSMTQVDAGGQTFLILSMHHALYDGEAMTRTLEEIELVLKSEELTPPFSFDPFLQRSIIRDFSNADAFWDQQLNEFQPQRLRPLSADERGDLSTSSSSETISVTEALPIRLSELETAAQDLAITLQTLIQAAWAKILCMIFNTTDVCFGTVFSGRTLPIDGLERLVAPCFNTLPVRSRLQSNWRNEDLLTQLQVFNAEALPYQFTPLRRIQSRVGTDGSPLFDTLVLMQRPRKALDEDLWSMVRDVGDMGFPVVAEFVPCPEADKLEFTLHLKPSLVPWQAASALFHSFNAALRSCFTDPRKSFKEFDYSALESLIADARSDSQESAKDSHDSWPDNIPEARNSATEDRVREVLSRFADITLDEVTPTKTIYQLGLDSISAIQIAKVLRSDGFQASSEHIMDGKSARGIATLIDKNATQTSANTQFFDFVGFDLKHRDEICSMHEIDASKISNVRPCTQSQAGMVSQSLSSDGSTYLNHIVYELKRGIEVEKFRHAWETVSREHEMLRTGFSTCKDPVAPFVMIHYVPDTFELPWEDLRAGEEDSLSALRKARKGIAQFLLTRLDQPPWRITVACDEDTRAKILQFSAHHALYDAESLRMILNDVINAYDGEPLEFHRSAEPLLSTILIQEGNNSGNAKNFWKSNLQDLTISKFPDLCPLRTEQRKIQSLEISVHNLALLEEGCRNLDINLQAALQVAWARLLSQYLGEDEVTFGVVLSGRDSDGADDIAFPSTTTVPYRCVIGSDVSSMLHGAVSYNTSVRKYQHSPLTQIKRWIECPSSSMFDTLLVFQASKDSDPVDPVWRVVDDEATVEYPLSIEITTDNGKSLTYRAVFWDDIIPKEQARLLLSQFESVVNDTVLGRGHGNTINFAEDQLSRLPPKDPEIQSAVGTLHGFVEATASQKPDKIALEFVPDLENCSNVRAWTFKELDVEGNKLANLVLNLSATPRSLIAVCFDKCAEASFSMLGVLKAGCGFIALDPTAPAARKAFILEDSKATIVLTTTDLAKDMDFNDTIKVICVDSLSKQHMDSSKPKTADQVQASDVSYCLYTSGSTGTPKGCLLSHENAVQAMLSFQRLFAGRWDDSSRWLQFASFHFDVSVLEQFWSWSVGICMVSTPRDGLFTDLPGALAKLGITHIDLTPSLARLVTPEQIPCLCKGVFITGGEPLKQEVLDSWGATGVIHNGYGPTEATIGCTMYPRVPRNGKPSNIGWQFDNVGSFVFAPETTDLVPRGAVGELCVSGKLVGLGYLNRPELTAESFPYIERYGERIYRTKDLVRMLHNGTFEFLGRCDDQVKLRGQRLELGEINNAIQNNVEKAQEVVTIIVKRSDNQSEQLVSFLALDQDTSNSISENGSVLINDAKAACQARLPSYMIPSHIILLESIPLTPNNKSDVKKLKLLFEESIKSENADSTSHSGVLSTSQRHVAEALAKFLSIEVDAVSPESNIFELGLDSISIYGFSRALQGQGYARAQPVMILQSHSIGGLTEALGRSKITNNDELRAKHEIDACQRRYSAQLARRFGVALGDVESVYPCTPLQQGMIVTTLEDDQRPYFNSFLLELHVDVKHFLEAIEHLVSSLPILRTTFAAVEQNHVQVVLARQSMSKHWLKSCEAECEDLTEVVERLRQEWFEDNTEDFRVPFQVISISHNGKWYAALNIFHGLYDASGFSLLLGKLGSKIVNKERIEPGPLFHNALAFGPLKKVNGAASFWKAHLRNASSIAIEDRDSPSKEATRTATLTLKALDRFETVRRELGVTHRALVQAAWTTALYDFLGGSTVLGVVVSGRSIALQDAEMVIGPMFNTIPMFLDIEMDDNWKSLAQRCHEFNMAALPFQHTALRDIQKWCGKPGRGSLFDTLFVFQKLDTEASVELSQLWTDRSSAVRPDYPLAFEAEHTPAGELEINIVAQACAANENQCVNLLKTFEAHFDLLLSTPEALICETLDVSRLVSPNGTNVDDSKQLNMSQVDDATFEWTDQARYLRRKIAELSHVDESSIKAYSSIFELGLDSIDAIKLSSALKRRHIHLPVSSIIRNPSIHQMMVLLSDVSSAATEEKNTLNSLQHSLLEYGSQMDINTTELEDITPATPLQEGLVAEMYASRFENYFNQDVLRLVSEADPDKLMKAVKTVCINTPILQTSFLQIDSVGIGCSFAQLVHKPTAPVIERIELSDSSTMADVLRRIREAMAAKFLDSSAQHLVPLKISIVVDGGINHLVISMAHALYDGWSIALFHEDISRAYHGQYHPRPDHKKVLATILDGESTASQEFWHDAVSNSSGCLFPTRELQYQETRRVHLKELVSKMPLSKIQKFCRDEQIGLQALGHLCWSFVLGNYAKSLDAVFGVVLSGREDEKSQQVMFPTMNTVVVRSILSGTRREMLKTMQVNMADLMEHQHFPLRKTQMMAQIPAGQLFNTLFIYQKRPTDIDEAHTLYKSVGGSSGVEYPVCVEMETVDNSFLWRTACEETALSEEGTLNLLQRLDHVLEGIIHEPDAASIEFADDGVSICALPPFETPQSSSEGTENQGDEFQRDTDSGASDKIELVVRRALSAASRIPENSISRTDTIFHLGLDSISLIKVASLLRKESLKISVSEMMKAGTVRGIALSIQKARHSSGRIIELDSDPQTTIDRVMGDINTEELVTANGHRWSDVEAVFPATPAQVYFISQWQNSKGAMFTPAFHYRVTGQVDTEQISRAWCQMVAANPILRTTFVGTASNQVPLLQVVLKSPGDSLITVSSDGVLGRRWDFSTPPVLLCVGNIHANTTELSLCIHHALYDAVSLPLLVQQLQDFCNHDNGLENGSARSTFTQFLAASNSEASLNARRLFWTQYLGSEPNLFPPGKLPSSKPIFDATKRTECYRPQSFNISSGLGDYMRAQGLSIQSGFLAACAVVYSEFLQSSYRQTAEEGGKPAPRDVVLGVYLANRSHDIGVEDRKEETGLAQLRMPTLNLVPLLVKSPSETPLHESAQQIQADLQQISSFENASVGLWEIDQWTGIKVDCFINFLKLPGDDDDSNEASKVSGVEHFEDERTGPNVKIESVDGAHDIKSLSSILKPFETPAALKQNVVKDCYPPSWDIEAAVRNGSLDIGIFGPSDIIDFHEANGIIDDLISTFTRWRSPT